MLTGVSGVTDPDDLELEKITEILDRGNTAEVKKIKGGVTILEISRKIRSRTSSGSGRRRTEPQRRSK
jgi:hypothetical protein